ncbi:DUF5796 family protein [Halorussus gelatinilyticus]|uniref:DUF5796 family protein n=1 Tax=Halorussus gelatinilyticus TaxID=2937524 RepID=A0A8U0IHD4_9EURY|nr:DUF5796 family protein [Halorussus gelatinilyticus]UPW00500.1 DUF5796 family protein [Halorussus gelatinilyticus]
MSARNDVAPDTLGVELTEDGIVVEYTDGREAFYRGVPTKESGTLRTQPGKLVQILVTDPTETEGVLTYVNDRNTHDDILESTGVGRVMLGKDEEEELFPGVTVRVDGYAIEVEADPETARGRVFVFEEDELGERSYELVNEE